MYSDRATTNLEIKHSLKTPNALVTALETQKKGKTQIIPPGTMRTGFLLCTAPRERAAEGIAERMHQIERLLEHKLRQRRYSLADGFVLRYVHLWIVEQVALR